MRCQWGQTVGLGTRVGLNLIHCIPGQVTSPLCSGYHQLPYSLGLSALFQKTDSFLSSVYYGRQCVLDLWAWQKYRGVNILIVTLNQWHIEVGKKKKKKLVENYPSPSAWSVELCSTQYLGWSEPLAAPSGDPLVIALLTLLSCCYHNSFSPSLSSMIWFRRNPNWDIL